MEKYYCEYCCLLYNKDEICKICGAHANNKIIIEVQKQLGEKNKSTKFEGA